MTVEGKSFVSSPRLWIPSSAVMSEATAISAPIPPMERLDDKRGCRVRSVLKNGGLVDEDKWPAIQDAMIAAMDKLAKAIKPHFARA
jgi:hypothetical protein